MLESGWSNKIGNIFAYQKWLNFLIMSEMIDKYIFIKTQNDSVACTEGVLDYCWRFGLNFQLKESRALPGCKMTSSRNNITLVNTSPCPIHQKLIFPNRCWFILTKCFLRGGIILMTSQTTMFQMMHALHSTALVFVLSWSHTVS